MREIADIDVGVIYTHERHYMPPLLASLAQSGDELALRLILVDNASTDGVEDWRQFVPRTSVVANRRRLGYAANLNRILSASTAPWVLLLNTDIYFAAEERCLTKMVRFMEAHPECGLSTCRVYHPDGSYGYSARRFQTPRIIALRRLGLDRLFPAGLDDHFYRHLSRFDSFPCEWVSGCFMLVRREAIQQVGGFDCRFHKYFEDVDLCARMAQAGWRVMFNGQTHCFHHEQRASRRLLSKDAWRHLCSYGRWLWKWGLRPPQPRLVSRALGERPALRIDAAHRNGGSPQDEAAAPRRQIDAHSHSGPGPTSP